jgi:hypothetical protein
MKTITAKHQTFAIAAGCDSTALAQRVYLLALAALASSTIGGLLPAEIEVSITVRGPDALAEIVEAAANGAQHGNGVDRARWERYAMGRPAGNEEEDKANDR